MAAAQAGLLPARLDVDGIQVALKTLVAQHQAGMTVASRGGYRRLADILDGALPPAVVAWTRRAHTAGVLAAVGGRSFDPIRDFGLSTEDDDDYDPETRQRWAPLLQAAGRQEFAIPCPYPPRFLPDGSLPLDLALGAFERNRNVEEYEIALLSIAEREPRDVDAHVHLGNLYLNMADDARATRRRSDPDLVESALSCYLRAVAVGELSLPDPFPGVLLWSELDCRPFLRAQYNLALAFWEQRRFAAAAAVLTNLVWLNPVDNQGAARVLADVRARIPRDPDR